jgi:hypothetical protein
MSNHDHDHDRDSDHANDNGEHERPGSKIAPAPAGGALTSLAALQTALAKVNTAAIIGRTGLPMLLFKREGSGTWGYGQKRTIPEAGSRWAVNPFTFKYGCICFNDANKVVGEHLVSISQPKPLITDMQDLGFPWQEQWAVNLKCLSGADAGVEVVFKATTDGGIKAAAIMVDLVRDRINNDQHDGKIVPIVLLEKDSYQHSQYGRVWYPVLNTVDWTSLDGPTPPRGPGLPFDKPAPPPPADAEQSRRRRVA